MACEQTNRGHQNVGDKGAHNSPEGRANNNANRHVEHAAMHRKTSKLLEHRGTFFPQERFRIPQVSHSEILENWVVFYRRKHTSLFCKHPALEPQSNFKLKMHFLFLNMLKQVQIY